MTDPVRSPRPATPATATSTEPGVLGRRTLFTSGAAGLTALALTGCTGSSGSAASATAGVAPSASGMLPAGTADGLPNTEPNRVADIFAGQKAVPVLRDATAAGALATARAWVAAGCRAVELTTTTPDVFTAVRQLADEGITVGVGTIRTKEQVVAAAEAGASFVLSFATYPALIEQAQASGLTPVPGTMTPTEVFGSLAAPIVKIFPASVLGVEYMELTTVLFPGIRTVATGGLMADPAIARAWLAAGATAVGPGGDLGGDPSTDGEAAVVARLRDYLAAVTA